MKSKLILFLAVVAFTFSCGHEAGPIELDNGKKWKIVESMVVYIHEMEDQVSNFKGNSLDEYKTLSTGLKENIGDLTSNCTMKGEAHDQLHNWLLPYIDSVNSFDDSKTNDEAAKHFQEIKTLFVTYNKYFE